jgi:hypothetical protein
VVTNIVYANATSASIERSMSYHGNCFGPIKREMLYEIKEGIRCSTQLGPLGGAPVQVSLVADIPLESKGTSWGKDPKPISKLPRERTRE